LVKIKKSVEVMMNSKMVATSASYCDQVFANPIPVKPKNSLRILAVDLFL